MLQLELEGRHKSINSETRETEEQENSHIQLPCATDWVGGHVSLFRTAVLVVDDSAFNRIVARRLMEAQEYHCAEASTVL